MRALGACSKSKVVPPPARLYNSLANLCYVEDSLLSGRMRALPGKPRILFICDSREAVEPLWGPAADKIEAVIVSDPMRAMASLSRE